MQAYSPPASRADRDAPQGLHAPLPPSPSRSPVLRPPGRQDLPPSPGPRSPLTPVRRDSPSSSASSPFGASSPPAWCLRPVSGSSPDKDCERVARAAGPGGWNRLLDAAPEALHQLCREQQSVRVRVPGKNDPSALFDSFARWLPALAPRALRLEYDPPTALVGDILPRLQWLNAVLEAAGKMEAKPALSLGLCWRSPQESPYLRAYQDECLAQLRVLVQRLERYPLRSVEVTAVPRGGMGSELLAGLAGGKPDPGSQS